AELVARVGRAFRGPPTGAQRRSRILRTVGGKWNPALPASPELWGKARRKRRFRSRLASATRHPEEPSQRMKSSTNRVLSMITPATLLEQERLFGLAFAAGDIEQARPLYHPEVVYLSPTVRLFGWPERIEGIDRTLAFIALTIRDLQDI